MKLEFKFQIIIPKFEGEGGHVYTVGIIPNWAWRRTYVHGSSNL